MASVSADLVEIARDFFAAHQLMRRIVRRFRSSELRFEELGAFIGDDEQSVLYRIKERCHALFRPRPGSSRVANPREVLFDLAVGSLFHEAMKFRENFYQREVYGPRVRAIRPEAGAEADLFLREFEKILSTVSERLEEGLQETETLLDQTGEQLRVLLAEHDADGLLVRYLVENAEVAESVFGEGLDALLAEVHGDAAAGFAAAGRSYLASGYYDAAEAAFASAIERGGKRRVLEPLRDYARGMAAYLVGDYDACLARLATWLDAAGEDGRELEGLAHAVVSRIGQLVEGEQSERVSRDAAELLTRLHPAPSGRAAQAF